MRGVEEKGERYKEGIEEQASRKILSRDCEREEEVLPFIPVSFSFLFLFRILLCIC